MIKHKIIVKFQQGRFFIIKNKDKISDDMESKSPDNPTGSGTDNNELELGILSAQYESEGNPGVISFNPGDPGGKSYGAWQLASRKGSVDLFLKWLKEVNSDFYLPLSSAKQKDGNVLGWNFDSTWKKLAVADEAGFLKAQHDYIKHAYYDKAAQKLQEKYDFDISTRSFALKNVLWSTAVQHGSDAAASIFAKTNLAGDDAEIINGVYNERQNVDVYFKNCSYHVKKGLIARFTKERKDALAMLT